MGSRIADVQCPECEQLGSVCEDTVRTDEHWIRHHECTWCGYKWVEIGAVAKPAGRESAESTGI
jgi:hypothetical protein